MQTAALIQASEYIVECILRENKNKQPATRFTKLDNTQIVFLKQVYQAMGFLSRGTGLAKDALLAMLN